MASHATENLNAHKIKAMRFGFILFLVSQGIPFVMLFSVKYVMDGFYKSPLLNPWLGAVQALLMILSGLSVNAGLQAIKRGNLPSLLQGFWRGIAYGLFSVLIMAYQWGTRFTPPTVRFGETYYSLTGGAGIYAVIGLFLLIAIRFRAKMVGFTKDDHWDADAATYFWTFTVINWLLTYIAIYWL